MVLGHHTARHFAGQVWLQCKHVMSQAGRLLYHSWGGREHMSAFLSSRVNWMGGFLLADDSEKTKVMVRTVVLGEKKKKKVGVGEAHQHEAERRREEAAQDQAGGPPENHPHQPPRRHRADLVPRGHCASVLFSPQLL